ncbi:hypothetical protein GCM10010486_33400 [Nonomuraea roseoviolacea subsp. carminata]
MARRSRRHLRQSPAVTGRGSTHIATAFMGLTSSGGVTVTCKLQARTSPVQSFSSRIRRTAHTRPSRDPDHRITRAGRVTAWSIQPLAPHVASAVTRSPASE